NWIDGYNKEVTVKAKKAKSTVANTNVTISIMDSTPAQAITAFNTSTKQISDLMKMQPSEDWTSEIDTLTKLNTKTETIFTFDKAYRDLMSGNKSYNETITQDYIITTKERQIADNITITVGGRTLAKDDLAFFALTVTSLL
ncbi:unnamed protein product, partial [marine sediment metagenome]